MPPSQDLSKDHNNHDAGAASSSSSGPPTGILRNLFAPRTHNQVLTDLAPQIFQSQLLSRATSFSPHETASSIGATSNSLRGRIGWLGAKHDSNSVYILERVDELLHMDVPPAPFDLSPPPVIGTRQQQSIEYPAPDAQVPLIRGFNATAPSAQAARVERRRKRAGLGEQALGLDGKLGLKARGDKARGLLGDSNEEEQQGVTELGINKRATASGSSRRKKNQKVGDTVGYDEVQMTPEDLTKDAKAVEQDMSNVSVKRALLNSQVAEIDAKIASLDAVRDGLRRNLLALREEELELQDELQGIQEQLSLQEERRQGKTVSASSRRRKGPAFLPAEHDDLPTGVAFMTLVGHLEPITALDFTEPYGIAVTASLDESVRFWDLTTGDEMGFLRDHNGVVKALQVESSLCVTGGADGQIRLWDLDIAEAERAVPLPTSSNLEPMTNAFDQINLNQDDVFGGGPSRGGAGLVNGTDDGLMREDASRKPTSEGGPCLRVLDGHTKAVTSLYFDESCLVTGSSDRTLRQWDLQTGQCVLTMDILWAISNPLASQTLSSEPEEMYSDPYGGGGPGLATPNTSPRRSLGRRQTSGFGGSPATTTYADGSWEMYEDFVGGVQFWGYALASGSGDGCVRMWDMRTGQAHRTLVGHTAPVTCVQFDERHLVSGSLDKSIRIWDLRTGSILDTIRYEHPITGLQFDSRKIVAAAGENGVRNFNRTTLQHSTLSINGHTSPVERLRFIDRYLATGGRDCCVKIWALP
ncbi:WD40 repeat-like protein [Meredithblackwellia eburnea MCA 4105]